MKKPYLLVAVLALFLPGTICPALLVVGNQTYQRDMSLAREGVQHLRTGVTLLEGLSQSPKTFDRLAVATQNAQREFAAASIIFARLNSDVKLLPGIGMSVTAYGKRLHAASHLLSLAMEVAQAGVLACSTLNVLIARFHDPLSAGLTMADFTVVERNFQQIQAELHLIINQVNSLQPGDLQLDPRLGKMVTTFRKGIPVLQARLDETANFLAVAPVLLGIGTPTSYLIEVLDSTELRPGGGFIGNYGIVTLAGGRLTAAHITDSYLLDKPFIAAGHHIPYPAPYTWFDLSPESWSFRDSNLDADFPTAARYAEQNYKLEGGSVVVQGVIAITPALIQQALAITGPIQVPEYKEAVTAQNLIERIHYHQLGLTSDGNSLIPSPDRLSSQRKHFMALLAEHFLARVHQLPSSDLATCLLLLLSAVRTKDIQVYLDSSRAENLLGQLQIDAAIQAPRSDSLLVVDANISPNKASDLITNTLDDQVSIDAQGNVTHHMTLRYAWRSSINRDPTQGPPINRDPTVGTLSGGQVTRFIEDRQVYGSSSYRDYVRVYVPPDSILQKQDGWQPRGASTAFGREVWAGFFTISYQQVNTITLLWKVPGAATRDGRGWQYQYMIQRQAGTKWNLRLQVQLPSCAAITHTWGWLVSNKGKSATFVRSLDEDMHLGIDYAC